MDDMDMKMSNARTSVRRVKNIRNIYTVIIDIINGNHTRLGNFLVLLRERECGIMSDSTVWLIFLKCKVQEPTSHF